MAHTLAKRRRRMAPQLITVGAYATHLREAQGLAIASEHSAKHYIFICTSIYLYVYMQSLRELWSYLVGAVGGRVTF